MKRLDPHEREQIKDRYLKGESSGVLAKFFGVSDVAVLKTLRKQGVQSRNPSEARRIYPVWDDAFRSPSPEGIYWIGFLMADGSVLDESKIQIALAVKDVGHLRKLRRFLKTVERPIYKVPSTKSRHLKVHSRRLVIDLARYGVVPRKTYCAKALSGIENEPAFWLGVLDGDGTIGLSKGRGRVRMYGTPTLMRQFTRFLVRHQVAGRSSGFRVKSGKRRDGLSEVALLGRRAANFLALVYAESPVCLGRKMKRAEEVGLIQSALRL